MRQMLIVFAVAMFLTAGTYAAVTVTTSDDSDFDSLDASIVTGSENVFSYEQHTGVSLAQTFTTGSGGLELMSVNLTYQLDTGTGPAATLTMHIFEVADSYAASITVPATTLLTETFDAPDVGTTDSTLTITLDSPLTLAADTSYAVYFDVSDPSADDYFEWFRTTSSNGDVYAGGAFYDDDDIKSSGERDGSLALVGVIYTPVVDAGADQFIWVADDGAVDLMGEIINYDSEENYTYTWSGDGVLFSAPVAVVDPNCPTTATFPGAGTYVLTLEVTNDDGPGSDTVTVAVVDPAVANVHSGHWSLDEGAGSTVADSSTGPFDQPGTVEFPDWQGGWVGCGGSSLWFNGEPNAVVTCPADTVTDPNTGNLDNIQYGITIAAWVNTVTSGSSQTVVMKDDSFELRIQSDGTARFKIWHEAGLWNMTDSDESDLGENLIVADGRWHHVAATYSAVDAIAAIYVDGILMHSEEESGPLNIDLSSARDPNMFIGRGVGSGGVFENGYVGGIDDVEVYSYALDASAIETLAAAGDSIPLVSAGPDEEYKISDILLQLQSFVIDGDSTPTIEWTVSSGVPASVTFTDASDPATTVGFDPGDTGTFELQLSVTDTLACGGEVVEIIDTVSITTVLPTCEDVVADGLQSRFDVAGEGGPTPDCRVNIFDFAEFVKEWLDCVDPEDPTCAWPW